MSEAVAAPWPNRDGYIHRSAALRLAIQAQYDQVGPIVPLSHEAALELHSRDVGANFDEPMASVYPNHERGTIAIVTDVRTCAVIMYSVRLHAASAEAHAREVRLLAERFPDGSYGRENRLQIAIRQERIARRARAVERAYLEASDTAWHGL